MEQEPKPNKSIEEMKQIADELERLEKEYAKSHNLSGIPYVHWIVEDLRKGDWDTAKTNYEQQSDKYTTLSDILKFLEKIGIAKNREDQKREWREKLKNSDD